MNPATLNPARLNLTTDTSRQNEPGLDGLRGIAALLVFVYHLRWIAGEPRLFFAGIDWQLVAKRLDIGVCLFFILSGYLLSKPFWVGVSTGRWPDLSRYAVRRFARIIPAYWLVLWMIAALSPSTYTMWGMVAFGLQLVGLHTFADYTYLGCVPVLWSIGTEMQYYALLPLLFLLANWIGRRKVWLTALALALIIALIDPAWRFIAVQLAPHLPGHIIPDTQSRVISDSVFYFLKWFGAGIAAQAARLFLPLLNNFSRIQWDLVFVLGIVAFATVVAYSSEGQWRSISRWGWPMSAIASALLVIASPGSHFGMWLDSPPLRILGNISYGIYLWHWPVLTAVFGGTLPDRLGPGLAFFVCGAITLAFTCLIAWLSHLSLERPVIAWAKRQTGAGEALRQILVFIGLRKAAVQAGDKEAAFRASH
ncbi:MAG: acyltransferase [Bryobacteraceae bacterium]